MTMNFEQFKEKLLMYGADVRCWPIDIRSLALKALESSPELQKLVEDEKRFEGVLNTRKYEEPSRTNCCSRSAQKEKRPTQLWRVYLGCTFRIQLVQACICRGFSFAHFYFDHRIYNRLFKSFWIHFRRTIRNQLGRFSKL